MNETRKTPATDSGPAEITPPPASAAALACPASYPAAFVTAVSRVLGDEGGYVDNPGDPGLATRYGISRREYPELDIAALTRAEAIAIYYRDWWLEFRLFTLPAPLATKLLVLAVNIGPSHAMKCLQRALRATGHRVVEDGVLGPVTRAAVERTAADAVLAALRSEAAGYYRVIAALARGSRRQADREFLAGWLNRAYE